MSCWDTGKKSHHMRGCGKKQCAWTLYRTRSPHGKNWTSNATILETGGTVPHPQWMDCCRRDSSPIAPSAKHGWSQKNAVDFMPWQPREEVVPEQTKGTLEQPRNKTLLEGRKEHKWISWLSVCNENLVWAYMGWTVRRGLSFIFLLFCLLCYLPPLQVLGMALLFRVFLKWALLRHADLMMWCWTQLEILGTCSNPEGLCSREGKRTVAQINDCRAWRLYCDR